MRFKTKGWARKVALPLLIISAAAWVVYVVGCSLLYNEISRHANTTNNTYTDHHVLHISVWIFLASGPPLYIVSFLHLLTGNSVVGLAGVELPSAQWFQNHFDSTDTRTWIQRYFVNNEYWDRSDGPVFLMLGGEVEASPTWLEKPFNYYHNGICILLWPFFIINTPKCCRNLTEEDRIAFSDQHSQLSKLAGFTQQPLYSVPPILDETKTEGVPPSNQQVAEETKS